MQIAEKLNDASKAKQIEQVLPLAIFAVYADSLVGVPPEKLVANLQGGFGLLSIEMQKIFNAIENGVPFQLAVKKVKCTSVYFHDFLLELTALHEGTGQPAALKKLANEILSVQRREIKNHSSKSSIAGLLLVAIGAVVPALFAAISLLGSVMGFSINAMQVFLAFILIFPLANVLLLLYIDYTSPKIVI